MDETVPKAVETDSRLTERWQSLVDMLYLTQVTWLYVFSALYPAMGLFFGVLFMAGSLSPRTKRIGKICLVLGIINTALVILAILLMFALGLAGALAGIGKD